MRVVRHKKFKKHFKARISPNRKLIIRFNERLGLFIKDKKNPILKDHKLVGKKKELRAFSITGDVRLVYKIENNELHLYNIGTHNQVY